MANLVSDPNASGPQFITPDGKRKTMHLGKASLKQATKLRGGVFQIDQLLALDGEAILPGPPPPPGGQLRTLLSAALDSLAPAVRRDLLKHWKELSVDLASPATVHILDALPGQNGQEGGYDILRIDQGGHQIFLHAPTLELLPDAARRELLQRVLAVTYFFARPTGILMFVLNEDLTSVANWLGMTVRLFMQRWRQPKGLLKAWRQEARVRLRIRCERPAPGQTPSFIVHLRPDLRRSRLKDRKSN